MKKVMFYGVLAISLALGACNQKAAAPKADDKMATDSKTVKIKLSELASNKDPNCEMTVEEGSIADTATYQGKIYGFCSSECKEDFLKDPKSHLVKK